MNQDKNKNIQGELVAQAAPLFHPDNCHLDFMQGMQYHQPFIYTTSPGNTDLDQCIICTFPPHFVYKVRTFRTVPVIKSGNDKELQRCQEAEMRRCEYLSQRWTAAKLGKDAQKAKKSVRKYVIENEGAGYDQELDEPRLVGKVPGLNIYLELVGCLDKITMDEIDWDGEHGAIATMNYALAYSLHFFRPSDRKRFATNANAPQLLDAWREDYDPALQPVFQPKNGLGYTNFDAARRFSPASKSF